MPLASDGNEIGIGFLGEAQYFGHGTPAAYRRIDLHAN